MAHHRFDPVAAYERLTTFDPATIQRRDRRALQRDRERLHHFIESTDRRLRDELELWHRIAREREAGREPTEQPTVRRLTDLPGVSEYFELAARMCRDVPDDGMQVDEAA